MLTRNYIVVERLQVVPILKFNKVQLFLSGHDHNLQHIQNATNVNEIDYVISGGGGRGLHAYNPDSATVLINRGFVIKLFAYVHGFVDLEFTADTVSAQYIDGNGIHVYSFSRGRSTEKGPRINV
jgi:tartrate-resistant acid phosphatase type 5